jgi:hypothetical protein
VLELMASIAAARAVAGWVLRTGMSPGADQAFYRGARSAGGAVELYLPWPGFQAGERPQDDERVTVLERPSPAAYELAARTHPDWARVRGRSRALLARDGHQVLGGDLQTPVRLLLCWTPDGGLDGADPRSGGTGQALRIAHRLAIPVVNLARAQLSGESETFFA